MMERQGVDASVERLLSGLIGGAVARTIVKQAHGRAGHLLAADDAMSARAFVRGPLLEQGNAAFLDESYGKVLSATPRMDDSG